MRNVTGTELCCRYMMTARTLYNEGRREQAWLYLAVAAVSRWGPTPDKAVQRWMAN